MRRVRWALLLSWIAWIGGIPIHVHAQGDEGVRRARAHFEVGLGMYNLGNYREALKEFAAGYQLTHKPKFLVNMGQAYRRLNELDSARGMYNRYLAEAAPNDPDRAQVLRLLTETSRPSSDSPAG